MTSWRPPLFFLKDGGGGEIFKPLDGGNLDFLMAADPLVARGLQRCNIGLLQRREINAPTKTTKTQSSKVAGFSRNFLAWRQSSIHIIRGRGGGSSDVMAAAESCVKIQQLSNFEFL